MSGHKGADKELLATNEDVVAANSACCFVPRKPSLAVTSGENCC